VGLTALYLVAGAFAFAPGLRAGLVSDSFHFLEVVRHASWAHASAWFVPSASSFYRPLYLAALWTMHQLSGTNPLGYHAVAWLAHVLSALLLAGVARALTGDRVAAGVAGLAFLWSIHAHEVVYDVAGLHHALAGTLLLASLLAWIRDRRLLSLAAVAVGMLVNELALIAAAILGWYECCPGVAPHTGTRAWSAARRLAPHVALLAGYFVWRLGLAGAALPSEGQTCLTPWCLAVAAAEYVNRLVVRPEALIAHVWTHRVVTATVVLVCAGTVVALSRPWAWRERAAALFAVGWIVIGVGYVVLALWPYVSDRFLYVADMGLALLLGCLAAELVRGWRGASGRGRVPAAFVLALLAAWIAAGGIMLRHRGALWAAAGSAAEEILVAIHAAVPAPPANARFCVHGVPESYVTTVAPGNTGPYVFRNGLPAALALRYGRSDLSVSTNCRDGSVTVRVSGAHVTVETAPAAPPPHIGNR
jgi:hypothetical protein